MKMKTPFVKAVLAVELGLLLALLATGCDNPADGNDGGTAIIAQEAADEFYAAHSVILEKPAGMLVLDDAEPVNAAWKAYGSLNAEAKALLSAEKANLDYLKAKVEALKSAADNSVYYTLHDLEAYLTEQPENGADSPYTVMYMGNETAKAVYSILAAAGRYVDLNLGMSNVQGFAGGTEEGRAFIVSLTLPDSLAEIRDGISGNEIFANFTNLKSVYAAGVQKLGAYAFTGCPALATVSLPAATTIGDYVFRGCISLATVNLPAATTIGSFAFYGCTGLTTVSLPSVVSINDFQAFRNCVNLATISLPAATTIGWNTFQSCTSLSTVSLPVATTISQRAFQGCTSLASITLPAAASIGISTFSGCANLATVSLPAAVSLDQSVFETCTSLNEVILGAVPPTIGTTLFARAATTAKTITIKTPYPDLYTAAGTPWTNTGDDTVWGIFWDGFGATKSNLTVTLETL
jgi:hypothetical protein